MDSVEFSVKMMNLKDKLKDAENRLNTFAVESATWWKICNQITSINLEMSELSRDHIVSVLGDKVISLQTQLMERDIKDSNDSERNFRILKERVEERDQDLKETEDLIEAFKVKKER